MSFYSTLTTVSMLANANLLANLNANYPGTLGHHLVVAYDPAGVPDELVLYVTGGTMVPVGVMVERPTRPDEAIPVVTSGVVKVWTRLAHTWTAGAEVNSAGIGQPGRISAQTPVPPGAYLLGIAVEDKPTAGVSMASIYFDPVLKS